MTRANEVYNSFIGGEVSPNTVARADLSVVQNGLSLCEDFIVTPQGGVAYRQGNRFVQYTRFGLPSILIPFRYSDQEAYILEFSGNATGVTAVRFYKDNAPITVQPLSITGITQANPAVVTVTAHGFTNNQTVYISGVNGMLEVNNGFYNVTNITTNTFTLAHQVTGALVDSSAFGAYTSGGTAARIYEIASPYLVDNLLDIRVAQKDNTMYFASQGYSPRKLVRNGHTNWSLSTYARTNDPFTGGDGGNNCPRAVCFGPDGRLYFGSTKAAPATVWASRAPTTSGNRYDDFTVGANATDAVIFELADMDIIEWMSPVARSILVGGYSNTGILYGATLDSPISPTTVNFRVIDRNGCFNASPVNNGSSMFFVQQDKRKIRGVTYSNEGGGYETDDRNEVAPHITKSGVVQIAQQKSDFGNILWAVREDGKLVGMTFGSQVSAWHRHKLGGRHVNSNGVTIGNGKVISAAAISRPDGTDQLWLIVERLVNGVNVRTIEYAEDPVEYPTFDDYFTGVDNKDADTAKFMNATYEVQKDDNYLDMSAVYDGSVLGVGTPQTPVNIATTTTRTITNITQANPGVVTTSAAHGYTTGDMIRITGVSGMTVVNNNYFHVTVLTTTTFQLTGVNTSGFSAYTSGGTATKYGVTQTVPPRVVTATAHGYSNGDRVYISGVGGSVEINNQYYIIGIVHANCFILYQDGTAPIPANYVDASAWTTFTSGGTVQRASGVTVTPGATTGNTVTFTASSAVFNSGMVGNEIRKKYDINGDGGGIAIIRTFTNSTNVVCDILSDFDDTSAMAAGEWLLTANKLYGLHHLIGEDVDVMADGSPLPDITVAADGTVTLGGEYSKVIVGYKHDARLKSLKTDIGGASGPAYAKHSRTEELDLEVLNTLGLKAGTSFYNAEECEFDSTDDLLDRPSTPQTGQWKQKLLNSGWSRKGKHWCLLHDTPTPATILSVGVTSNTTDEPEQQYPRRQSA